MQTQVCWSPNPVFFPLPLEEELGGAPSALTLYPPPLHMYCGTIGQAGASPRSSQLPFSHSPVLPP